jgi:t-SNARE complex subunit (syntaxin)
MQIVRKTDCSAYGIIVIVVMVVVVVVVVQPSWPT